MARIVLVHGSFHGRWCWEKLIPRLEAFGHTVVAPDLPGSGDDLASVADADLAGYAARIGGAVEAFGDRVLLVGHSMGGIVSSQVAERHASRIAATVYVNGLLLADGESLVSFLNAHAHLGVEDLVLKNMRVSPDGASATFPAEAAGEVFYNTCTPEDAAAAAARLTPQRMKVYGDGLRLTGAGFGTVRRFYVEGTHDHAVSLAYQRAMVARTPCEEVFTLEGDHSPFLSAPDRLADILHLVALRTL